MKKITLITLSIFCSAIITLFVVWSIFFSETELLNVNSAIQNTNGVLHIVPLTDIISGGPEKDQIPEITNPEFLSFQEAKNLYSESDTGVVLHGLDVQKFYPLKILAQHQIINDSIEGRRVLITYSPLTKSAVAFDPTVQNEQTLFANMGTLWDSNLILYDKKTESQWSQLLGTAIVGPMSGAKLEKIPCSLQTFGSWSRANPQGKILTFPKDSGFTYTKDPNDLYYESDSLFFPVLNEDTRLSAKEEVVGIVINDSAKAYAINSIKELGAVSDSLNGTSYNITYSDEFGIIRAFEKNENGNQKEIAVTQTYWFAWVGAYPNTQLYN